jgi:hypothetical protein
MVSKVKFKIRKLQCIFKTVCIFNRISVPSATYNVYAMHNVQSKVTLPNLLL